MKRNVLDITYNFTDKLASSFPLMISEQVLTVSNALN